MAEDRLQGALKKLTWLTTVVLIAAVAYVGVIFYSRRQDAKDAAARQAEKDAENAQFAVDKYGGDRVKILAFSASSAVVRRGQAFQLCYGVANAKTVKIEPPVGEIWPSMSRCLDVSPKKDTQYTITAQDAAGHTDTAQISVAVR